MLVIHMDPVETKDEHVLEAKEKVEKVLRAMDPKLSIHDFRMVPGTDQINLIFDLVVPFEYDQKKQVMQDIADYLNKKYGEGTFELTIEESYRNMKEKIEPCMHLIDNAKKPFRNPA